MRYLLKGHSGYEEAIYNFQKGAANTTENRLKANIIFYMGLTRFLMYLKRPELSCLTGSAGYFKETMTMFEEWQRKYPDSLAKVLGNLGLVYQKLSSEDASRGQEYLNEAIGYYQRGLGLSHVKTDKALIQLNLGTAFVRVGEMGKAITCFTEAGDGFSMDANFQFYQATALANLGIVLTGTGVKDDLDNAGNCLQQACELFGKKHPEEYQWACSHREAVIILKNQPDER